MKSFSALILSILAILSLSESRAQSTPTLVSSSTSPILTPLSAGGVATAKPLTTTASTAVSWSAACAAGSPLATCIQASQQNQIFSTYGCTTGNYACVTQQQQLAAQGCPAGAYQSTCIAQLPSSSSLLAAQQQQQQQQQSPAQQMAQMMQPGGGAGANNNANNNLNRNMGTSGDREVAGSAGGSGGYSGSAGPYTSAQGMSSSSGRGTARIVDPVKKWWPKCTEKLGLGNCEYRNDGIWGDARHQASKSCHNTGDALDIGFPLKCAGGKTVSNNDPKAMQLAVCMATQTDGTFGVIFKDQTPAPNMTKGHPPGAHATHMHVKLKSCPY